MREEPIHIVILGGGFGGVYTALDLETRFKADPDVAITLISRENYFLMTPLLFEASSGVLEPRHAVNPIRPLLGKTRFIEADVEAVDLDGKVVYARHDPASEFYEIAYDQIVFALGGITNRALIPGSEHAMAFKTLADAIMLRNHLIDVFEQADAEEDPARRQALLTFVVVGAGLVGIELTGELTEFLAALGRHYPRVDARRIRIHVIEAMPEVLGELDRDLAAYAVDTLESRGVQIRTGTPVEAIAPGEIRLGGGTRLASETILLAAGVGPNPLLAALPLTRDRKGRIQTDATMRAVDRPDVWALGDCAAIPDPTGKPYPQLAQHALREARVLAANLEAALKGGAPSPFVYHTVGTLASLGGFQAVGRVGRYKFRGPLAWAIWRGYYLNQMPKLERRLRILIDWTVALFFPRDVAKLELYKPAPVEVVLTPAEARLMPHERVP